MEKSKIKVRINLGKDRPKLIGDLVGNEQKKEDPKIELKINMGEKNVKHIKGKLVEQLKEAKKKELLAKIEEENKKREKAERIKLYEKFYNDTPDVPLSNEYLVMRRKIEDGTILEYIKEKYPPIEKYKRFSVMDGEIEETNATGKKWHGLSVKREFSDEVGHGYEKWGIKTDRYGIERDLEYLEDNYPDNRYKFYLSLNLEGEIKKRYGKKFGLELLRICKEKKLSITTKTSDHTYDSFNIYTWDKREMAKILTKLYKKYKPYGIFLDTFHFLQEPLKGVSEKHIGCVHEPVGGVKYTGDSHSVRMMRLGNLLDRGVDYVEACNIVGIIPEQPWKLK